MKSADIEPGMRVAWVRGKWNVNEAYVVDWPGKYARVGGLYNKRIEKANGTNKNIVAIAVKNTLGRYKDNNVVLDRWLPEVVVVAQLKEWDEYQKKVKQKVIDQEEELKLKQLRISVENEKIAELEKLYKKLYPNAPLPLDYYVGFRKISLSLDHAREIFELAVAGKNK